jgi:hypothetical protein
VPTKNIKLVIGMGAVRADIPMTNSKENERSTKE